MSPVPSFSTRRWERKSSSRARSCTFMTLVERHFILEGFLYRGGTLDEMAIWDGFGERGRRGEEMRERERENKEEINLWRRVDTTLSRRRPYHPLHPLHHPSPVQTTNQAVSFSSSSQGSTERISTRSPNTKPSSNLFSVSKAPPPPQQNGIIYACFCFPVRNFLK
jgi:hypothetical protein